MFIWVCLPPTNAPSSNWFEEKNEADWRLSSSTRINFMVTGVPSDKWSKYRQASQMELWQVLKWFLFMSIEGEIEINSIWPDFSFTFERFGTKTKVSSVHWSFQSKLECVHVACSFLALHQLFHKQWARQKLLHDLFLCYCPIQSLHESPFSLRPEKQENKLQDSLVWYFDEFESLRCIVHLTNQMMEVFAE